MFLRSRRTFGGLLTIIASLGELGRSEEAQPYIAEIATLNIPDLGLQWRMTTPYADSVHAEQFLQGLAKAGYQLQ